MSHHVVILGAGISGLATAWFLKQRLGSHVRLTLLEKESRVGGWIQTIHSQGFLFEQGPRSCRTKGTGQETLALIEALGLQDQVLAPHPDAHKRYIYQDAGLQCLPKHVWKVPFNALTRGWLKALWRDWRMPKRQKEDESIQDFFARRLGNGWMENLIDPFVSGIYAGDCSRLSLKSCFPLFDQWEQQYGSLVKGAWRHQRSPLVQSSFIQSMCRFPLFSFKQGMETLPRALAHELKDCLRLNQTVKGLKLQATGVEINLQGGERLTANHVISTLPTYNLSALLASHSLLDHHLKELPYASVVVVNIGFEKAVLPLKGFGYLVPSKMKLPVLGCVWDSSLFPVQNQKEQQTRLTMMLGGSHHPEIVHLSESKIVELVRQALQQHLGIHVQPQVLQVKQAYQAIPQYEVGYAVWKKKVQASLQLLSPCLILSGSAWTGVSINDCIAQARQLAHRISLD